LHEPQPRARPGRARPAHPPGRTRGRVDLDRPVAGAGPGPGAAAV